MSDEPNASDVRNLMQRQLDVTPECVNVCYCTEYEPEDGTCTCGHPWTGHEFDVIPEGCCVTRIPCDHPERDEARAQLQAARRLLATLDGGLDDMTMRWMQAREQVATLTAERDEARAQHGTDVHNLMQRQLEVLHERDALRAEVRRIAGEGIADHQDEGRAVRAVCFACADVWPCDDYRRYAALAALAGRPS